MVLFLYAIISMLVCWGTAISRDVGKNLKTLPFVTNSLVNLGKMDIAFHFNARPQGSSDFTDHASGSIMSPKLSGYDTVIEEPCPCSNFKYLKDSSQNHPTELLNKILHGNDFFSFKDPVSSPLCCDSHEHVQEDILLEFGPKQNQVITNSQNPFQFLPYILDSLQKRPTLPIASAKPKAVEIFFFPKKQGILPSAFEKFTFDTNNKELNKKESIKIVGDREVKNEFKSQKFLPPISSVKKDLAIVEKTKYVTKKMPENQTTAEKQINNSV